jgi:hypothetical protein
MTEEQLQQIADQEARKAELEALPVISFEEYEKRVHRWMLLADPGILKILPAVYVANFLEGRDPVWVMFVGPSGGGKTELLGMLNDMPKIYPISLLTPNTFLSGFPGRNDSSLLPKVNDRIMSFKDWTSILSMNKDARAEILGQMREIFDGSLKKPFGNGKVAEWKGKVGMIAGCTPAVDIAAQMHASLGERFIYYRIAMPDRTEVAYRCLVNNDSAAAMRKDLKDAFYSFMKGVQTKASTDNLPDEVKAMIVRVANVATLARSGVIRDLGPKKEVVYVPSPEMPTRIVQQLATLATALMLVNGGKFDQAADGAILMKVAMDSIPQTNRMVMEAVAVKAWQTTADVAAWLGYPTSPVRMYLENLAMLGVVNRVQGKNTSEEMGAADRWEMCSAFVAVMNETMGKVPASYRPPATVIEKEVPVEEAML